MEPTSIRFAAASATIGRAARARGVEPPAFRSPPSRRGAVRTIRRSGSRATVAVAIRGRPWSAVLADMVEGVIVASGLSGSAATSCREALWSALEGDARARAA